MIGTVRVVALLIGLVACVRSQSVTCGDGTVCPDGDRCDAERQRCISPAQIRACMGLADGTACTTEAGVGVCGNGVCDLPICGDGVREGTEECDGADLGGADCTSSAQIHAQFYAPAGLTCAAGCTYDIAACTAYCGDGAVNGPEVCDGAAPPNSCVELGMDAGATACNDLCGFGFDSCARFGFQFEAIGAGQWSGIGGAGHADQWAVGSGGIAAHYNGHGWSTVATGVSAELQRVWAVAPADVWAIASDAVVHWNGSGWAAVAGVPPGAYHDVWAANAGAVFIATDHGLARWDGTAWQVMPGLAGPVYAVAGTSASDLWAAGADVLSHWNGSTWAPTATIAARRLIAFSPAAAWAVGQKTSALGSVATIGRWNGTAWTLTDDNRTLQLDVAGTSDDDVWVTSSAGDVRHWDGHGFVDTSVGNKINGLHAFGTGDVVAIDGIGARRFRGQKFVEAIVQSPASSVLALAGEHPSSLVLGDVGGRLHPFDGSVWTTAPAQGAPISSMVGFGTEQFVGRTNGVIDHLAAGVLVDTHEPSGTTVLSLWGSSPSDLYAVAGGLYHYDGATWSVVDANQPADMRFETVAGSGPSDVWVTFSPSIATGTPAYLSHFDGTSWQLVDQNGDSALVAVGPGEMFAVVQPDRVLHYRGGQVTETHVPAADALVHIAASAPDDVVVVSRDEAFHFDGTRWTPVRLPIPPGQPPTITALAVKPGYIAFVLQSTFPVLELLIRTRPWTCRAHETSCSDGVDDDCDDLIDARDADCH